ncbi:MAG: hypothetical protein RLZZ15_1796, partial [Verrucomicrobiota bacterium]
DAEGPADADEAFGEMSAEKTLLARGVGEAEAFRLGEEVVEGFHAGGEAGWARWAVANVARTWRGGECFQPQFRAAWRRVAGAAVVAEAESWLRRPASGIGGSRLGAGSANRRLPESAGIFDPDFSRRFRKPQIAERVERRRGWSWENLPAPNLPAKASEPVRQEDLGQEDFGRSQGLENAEGAEDAERESWLRGPASGIADRDWELGARRGSRGGWSVIGRGLQATWRGASPTTRRGRRDLSPVATSSGGRRGGGCAGAGRIRRRAGHC